MIGTWTRSALSRRAISKPSMSGSMTSRTSRSGLNVDTASKALRPSPADSTVKPWKRRAIEITSAMFGSSSTTSPRWLSGVAVVITLLSVGPQPQRFLGASQEPPARRRGDACATTRLSPVVPGARAVSERPTGPAGALRRRPRHEVVEVLVELGEDLVALGARELLVGDGLVELLG